MNRQPKTADLTWRDGVIPVATQFDDPYFSLSDGLEETRHVFLAGNDLPARFSDGFHIAELGFGTGLNLLAAIQLWRETGQKGVLHYTSFEAFPMTPADMLKALTPWASLASLTQEIIPHLASSFCLKTEDLHLDVIIGDARQTLPRWSGHADAWFLDGFSPAKNPQMWQADVLQAVGDHTKDGGSFATYTAAGHVRQKLTSAGFTVSRIKGHGRKRHMSVGTLAAT